MAIHELLSRIDPNNVPQPEQTTFVEEALEDSPTGRVLWNPMTGVIRGPILQGAFPIKERRFMVDQPFVSTCSRPSPTNLGCRSYDGCPFGRARKWLGRWNAIMERRGYREVFACEQIYTAIRPDGRKVNHKAAIANGWKFVTDRIDIDRTITKQEPHPITGQLIRKVVKVKDQVPNLGPMYAHLTGKNWEAVEDVEEIPSQLPLATISEREEAKWGAYGDRREENPEPASHPVRAERGHDRSEGHGRGDRGNGEGRALASGDGDEGSLGTGQRRGKTRGKARNGNGPTKRRGRAPNKKGHR